MLSAILKNQGSLNIVEVAFLFLVPAVIPTSKHRETIQRQEAA